jgi:hypothetical protein
MDSIDVEFSDACEVTSLEPVRQAPSDRARALHACIDCGMRAGGPSKCRAVWNSDQTHRPDVCRLAGLSRTAWCRPGRGTDHPDLRMRIRDIAARRPRFSYQRIHVMLRREGWPVNKKPVRRLYSNSARVLTPPVQCAQFSTPKTTATHMNVPSLGSRSRSLP